MEPLTPFEPRQRSCGLVRMSNRNRLRKAEGKAANRQGYRILSPVALIHQMQGKPAPSHLPTAVIYSSDGYGDTGISMFLLEHRLLESSHPAFHHDSHSLNTRRNCQELRSLQIAHGCIQFDKSGRERYHGSGSVAWTGKIE